MRKKKDRVNAELQAIVRSTAFRRSGIMRKKKDRVNAELQTIVRSTAFRRSGIMRKKKDRVNAELQTIVRSTAFRRSGIMRKKRPRKRGTPSDSSEYRLQAVWNHAKEKDRVNAELQTISNADSKS